MSVKVPTLGSWLLLSWVTAFSGGPAYRSPPAPAPTLAGTWRLVSLVSVRSSGEVTTGWRGPHPTGRLIYDSAGHMAVQIRRDPPARMTATDSESAPVSEQAEAFAGYYAYYGRYQVDSAKGLLRHMVEVSLWPTESGVTYQHQFQLRGDSLTLEGSEYQSRGEKLHSRLLWLRVH